MDFPILKSEIQAFIKANTEAALPKLAFQKNPFPEVQWQLILEQIGCRQKAQEKLPTWFSCDNIIYPSKISIEQTSSEKTAAYKASLLSGKNIIDATGGFGIDSYYFSKIFESVIHCEMNATLSSIVQHNFEVMKVNNVKCIPQDSLEVLKTFNSKFDWIYIDPSRRHDAKGKVFLLKDCAPNVPELLDTYFEYSNHILIKTAPILDIAAGLNELKNVEQIHIVAVENEVKELLWEISKGYEGTIAVKTVNLKKDQQEVFDFILHEKTEAPSLNLPQRYLYEPNSAIMKSGGFTEVGIRFGLDKLHAHSQLYTSNQMIEFPGRIFEIHSVIPYQKSAMKASLEGKKANITTRNFPDSVEDIRKKWKIANGGNDYCFFTTDMNNDKIVLLCTKI